MGIHRSDSIKWIAVLAVYITICYKELGGILCVVVVERVDCIVLSIFPPSTESNS